MFLFVVYSVVTILAGRVIEAGRPLKPGPRPGAALTALPPPPQREHMMSCYWEQPGPLALRHDPSRPYAEQYRIDARQFARLFQLVSPWTCGAHTDILAERTFRLLDDNMDHLIEFKAFVSCLGMTLGLYCSKFIGRVMKQARPLREVDLCLV